MLDVIIPTKNSAEVIEECLLSLSKQLIPVNIIIVDAHSTDETRDIAAGWGCKIYDEPPSNVKGSRRAVACNEGLRHSTSELVAFLDSDTVIPETWSTDNEYAIVSFGCAAITSGCVFIDTPANRIMSMGSPNHAKEFIHFTELTSVPGYNAVYRRSALDKVGHFAEEIGGCEDFELNHRLRKAGFKLYGIPHSPVIHKERSDIKGFAKQIRGYGWSRSRLLKTKHIFSLVHILPLLALFFINLLAASLLVYFSVGTTIMLFMTMITLLILYVRFPYHYTFLIEWSIGYIYGLID